MKLPLLSGQQVFPAAVVGPAFSYFHGGDAFWAVIIWMVGLCLIALLLVWVMAKLLERFLARVYAKRNK
jgi:hypothetical protein